MNGLTPDITAAEVVRHGVLRLTFADGLSGEVDVLDRMRGPVFNDARTLTAFPRSRLTWRRGPLSGPGVPILPRTRFTSASDPVLGQILALRPSTSVLPGSRIRAKAISLFRMQISRRRAIDPLR